MRLIIVLNLLLAVVYGYSCYQVNDSLTRLDEASAQLDVCQNYAAKIDECRLNSKSQGIAKHHYDCAPDIMRLVNKQSIHNQRVIASRQIANSESGFVTKSIDNPIGEPVELRQIVGLLQGFENNAPRFFVESIELTRPGRRPNKGEAEFWDVSDLQIRFISTAKP